MKLLDLPRALIVLSSLLCIAQTSTLTPAVLPLAVRNPYLSLWVNSRLRPFDVWPQFWTGQEIGFGVLARVRGSSDGSSNVYPLFGRPQDALDRNDDRYDVKMPKFMGYSYDADSTTLTYVLEDGAIGVQLLWTSPITRDDIMRQGLPASYLEVKVNGTMDVDIYVDVNGMFVTYDRRGAVITWDFERTESHLQSWVVKKQTQARFTERGDRAEWGTFYLTAPIDPSITYQCSTSGPQRRNFASTGTLTNKFETHWRDVLDDEPAFAFAKRFTLTGANSTGSESALYTIALAQDPIAQFAAARGLTEMKPLWKSYFATDREMLDFHYSDYANATSISKRFAHEVTADAREMVSDTYADIVSLAARQVLGATYFSGTPSDPVLWMKEISSNGNFQTVDVIFPSIPFFLYVNSTWLSYLMEPLLEHQGAGLYPNKYSMHDLGYHFPNATGHADGRDEKMPVEECGNMLIMALAYAQSVDHKTARKWIEQRYQLWTQWTSFLVVNSLVPDYQLSTDDFAGRLQNQTNLALKGLIGIRAMAGLAAIVGNDADAELYTNISDSYLPLWRQYALSRDNTHLKLAYHWQGSWGTLYNLYAAPLLCFHISGTYPTEDIYTTQSSWYDTVHQNFGLPLDSRHLYTKSDWQLWAAAVSSPKTRDEIVQSMGRWVNETSTDRAMTDLYDTEGTGGFPGITFKARPVVGGLFSVLALKGRCDGKAWSSVQKIFGESGKGGGHMVGGESQIVLGRPST